jgi:hypothetical protein
MANSFIFVLRSVFRNFGKAHQREDFQPACLHGTLPLWWKRSAAAGLAALALFFCLYGFVPVSGAGSSAPNPTGPVALTRRYRPGQMLVYRIVITIRTSIQSAPAALNPLLSEVPRAITIQAKNTLTVEHVLPNRSAVVRCRFDSFQVLTMGNWANAAESHAQREIAEDLSQQVTGQVLTVRYDRNGNLLGFTGAQPLLGQVEAPTRAAVKAALRAFLAQLGGSGFDPGHVVRSGQSWKRSTTTPVDTIVPASFESESIFQYKHVARYNGINAAVIDFRFADSLKPRISGDPPGRSPSAPPYSWQRNLDFLVSGEGSGMGFVALSNGTVLEKHATFQETIRGSLNGVPGLAASGSPAATVEVRTQDSLQMTEQ